MSLCLSSKNSFLMPYKTYAHNSKNHLQLHCYLFLCVSLIYLWTRWTLFDRITRFWLGKNVLLLLKHWASFRNQVGLRPFSLFGAACRF